MANERVIKIAVIGAGAKAAAIAAKAAVLKQTEGTEVHVTIFGYPDLSVFPATEPAHVILA